MWRFGLTTLNVPSGFIVQTVPRELVHVPTSGPAAVGALVAQAFKNRRKTPAKAIRRVGCIFMSFSLSGWQLKVKLRWRAYISCNGSPDSVKRIPWNRQHRPSLKQKATGGHETGNGLCRPAALQL